MSQFKKQMEEPKPKKWVYIIYDESQYDGKLKAVGYSEVKSDAKAYVRDRRNANFIKIPFADFKKMNMVIEEVIVISLSGHRTYVLSEEEFTIYENMMIESYDKFMHAIDNIIVSLPALNLSVKKLAKLEPVLTYLRDLYKYLYVESGDMYDMLSDYKLVELYFWTTYYKYSWKDIIKIVESRLRKDMRYKHE